MSCTAVSCLVSSKDAELQLLISVVIALQMKLERPHPSKSSDQSSFTEQQQRTMPMDDSLNMH